MHTPIDVALVSLYVVVWLLVELWRLPRVRARMERAPLGARAREYYWTIATQWALVLAVFGRLAWTGAPAAAIGLRLPQGAVGWAVSVAAIALTLWHLTKQERAATGSERGRATLARGLAPMAWLLPRERREFAAFTALSITAGVCEEILYRGHLMAFFDSLIGPVLSTLAAVALFGLAHSYQGKNGVVQTAIVGLIMALVYRGSGSLLAPIVMHALLDQRAGRMVERALALGTVIGPPPAEEPQAEVAPAREATA